MKEMFKELFELLGGKPGELKFEQRDGYFRVWLRLGLQCDVTNQMIPFVSMTIFLCDSSSLVFLNNDLQGSGLTIKVCTKEPYLSDLKEKLARTITLVKNGRDS